MAVSGFTDRLKGKGFQTSSYATQFGKGGAFFLGGGNLRYGTPGSADTQANQISAAGISPGATAADNVLFSFLIPANSFDVAGRTIQIQAAGSTPEATNTKTLKLIFGAASATVGSTIGAGGATIASTSTFTTQVAWSLQAQVIKYGAAGSNTQLAIHTSAVLGAVNVALTAPQALSSYAENAPIWVALTGNAATAVGNILANYFAICALD